MWYAIHVQVLTVFIQNLTNEDESIVGTSSLYGWTNQTSEWDVEAIFKLLHQLPSKQLDESISICKVCQDGSGYLVEINKSKQFLLATRFVGCGMSFAMANDAIHDANDVCDIPKLGVCNDFLVASYARVACAI